jgi:hypothetical protein
MIRFLNVYSIFALLAACVERFLRRRPVSRAIQGPVRLLIRPICRPASNIEPSMGLRRNDDNLNGRK